MKVLDSEGNFSQEEWEVAGIYLAFVFRKEADKDTPTTSPYGSPRPTPPLRGPNNGYRGGSPRNHGIPSNRYRPYNRQPPNGGRPPYGRNHPRPLYG